MKVITRGENQATGETRSRGWPSDSKGDGGPYCGTAHARKKSGGQAVSTFPRKAIGEEISFDVDVDVP